MDVVLATGNAGKVRELQALLQPLGITVHAQSAYDVPAADETGLSFIENALLKARHCSRLTGLPALADDSGLVVDALSGAPGIYSARYAGQAATDADNVQKLLHTMRAVPAEARGAHFHCSLVWVQHADDPDPLICQGRWFGEIATEPFGAGGFGYDPVFFVRALNRCAAQLSPAEKNAISHRGMATRQRGDALRQR